MPVYEILAVKPDNPTKAPSVNWNASEGIQTIAIDVTSATSGDSNGAEVSHYELRLVSNVKSIILTSAIPRFYLRAGSQISSTLGSRY